MRSPIRTPSSTTRPDHSLQTPELEPSSDLLGHQGRQRAGATVLGSGTRLPAVQHRAAVDARLRGLWPTRPSPPSPPGRRSSPASGPRASTSTSVPSSTSAILRPFEQDHTTFGLANTGIGQMAKGVNSTAGVNVHSIAIQVPIGELTGHRRNPTDEPTRRRCIGVWTTASRQKASIRQNWPGSGISTRARSPKCPGSGTRWSTRW